MIPDKDDLTSTDLTARSLRPSSLPIGAHISYLHGHFIRPVVGGLGHAVCHMGNRFGHAVAPVVGSVGHATNEVRWHRSYDDANNRTDRGPYREKAVKSSHSSQGDHEDDTN